eukprot:1070682-Pleurochrysis_carterae.AAC.4
MLESNASSTERVASVGSVDMGMATCGGHGSLRHSQLGAALSVMRGVGKQGGVVLRGRCRDWCCPDAAVDCNMLGRWRLKEGAETQFGCWVHTRPCASRDPCTTSWL